MKLFCAHIKYMVYFFIFPAMLYRRYAQNLTGNPRKLDYFESPSIGTILTYVALSSSYQKSRIMMCQIAHVSYAVVHLNLHASRFVLHFLALLYLSCSKRRRRSKCLPPRRELFRRGFLPFTLDGVDYRPHDITFHRFFTYVFHVYFSFLQVNNDFSFRGVRRLTYFNMLTISLKDLNIVKLLQVISECRYH